jgi:hypothetical protein
MYIFVRKIGAKKYFDHMSVEQVESTILELAPAERRQLLLWLDEHRHELFCDGGEVTDAQKAELLRRRQEYFDHPERFARIASEEELDRFFEDIRHEVQTRLSPARPV